MNVAETENLIEVKNITAKFKGERGEIHTGLISVKNLDLVLGRGNSSIKINTGVS